MDTRERPGRVLRLPGVARLTLALLLSNTADTFALMALLWFVMANTGSSVTMGMLVLCSGLPALVTAPLAGRLLDRMRPGPLMAVDNLARAAVLGVVIALHLLHALTVPALLGLVVVSGALSPATFAGCRVLVPRLVPERDLTAANGVLSVGDQFPLLIGPAAAGPMVAWLGGPLALTLPVVALVVAGWLLLGLPSAVRPAPSEAGAARAGLFGLGPLVRSPALRALLVLSITYFFAYGPLEASLPIYVNRQLGQDATVYGLLWMFFGAGALAGLATVRPLGRLRPGMVNALSTVGWGVVLIPLALFASTPVACVLMFCGAFVWAPYTAVEISTIQRLVPASQHGAVLGARRAVLVVASPAGAAVGGVLLTWLNAAQMIAISGIACIVIGLACLATRGIRAIPPASASPRQHDVSRPVVEH